MECIECGATGYGLHHSASCKYLNVDVYKKLKQLEETKTVEVRKVTDDFIEHIESFKPKTLEIKYKYGDFLYVGGLAFKMVHYSMESLPSGQSIEVSYWCELYDLEINLNFVNETVSVDKPVSDWRALGF